MSARVKKFMAETIKLVDAAKCPSDCVESVAPLMLDLLESANDFLQPEHLRSSSDGYARNAISVDQDGGPSLYSLVWAPGRSAPHVWLPVLVSLKLLL